MDSLIDVNFVFDATLDNSVPDGDKHLIIQKNVSPYFDQQKGVGSYNNGKVIIDAQTGNGSDFNDYSNAYITLPYLLSCTDTVGADPGTITASGLLEPSLLIGLKNESLIDSIRIEQGGRTIVNESQNLSHLINFVKHCTSTKESIATDTRFNKYSPDGCNQSGATIGTISQVCAATGIAGVNNVQNVFVGSASTTANGTLMNVNSGLLDRQLALFPPEETFFSTQAQKAADYLPVQDQKSFPISSTGTLVLSRIHFLAVIYLRDLSDFFKKIPLSKGGYKITLTVNQATTTFGAITSANPFQALPTNTVTNVSSGSVQPMMFSVGPGTSCANLTYSASVSHTIVCQASIDTSTPSGTNNGPLQNGVCLYVPTYTMAPEYEQKLLNKSVVHRSPYMVNGAVYVDQVAATPINLQLFTAISNPRALIIIPQYATSAQTQPSHASIFNSCPGTSDPYLSLQRLQIRINGKGILPSPINYAYQQFIENTSKIFKLNGGQSDLTSGVVSMTKFSQNYRYYSFDLDLLPEDQIDVPQIITLEGYNNSAVKIDLYVYVLYAQDANFDLLKGTVEVR